MTKVKIWEKGERHHWPSQVSIYTDGASRGNPGPASYGFTVKDKEGHTIYERCEKLGTHTNNYAEYMAVLTALQQAVRNRVQNLTLNSDSELLVKQLSGDYKVRSESLKPLFTQCQELLKQIKHVKIQHVRREHNQRADALANFALDQ